MPEFVGALPLLAVGVMAVNDAYLKATFHNAITGKLSDFAGCFFLPLYTSALLALVTPWSLRARLTVGALATAVLFVAISTSKTAARWVCDVLSVPGGWLGLSHYDIVADPTDLMALPMVPLAVFYGLRRSRSVGPKES